MSSLPAQPNTSSPNYKQVGRLKYFTSDMLGKGGFGWVYKGELDDGTAVAVKRILTDNPDATNAIKTELRHVQFGQETCHENLVRYLHQENDENFVYIVIELCVGTLEDLIEKKIPMNVPFPGPNEEILRQITSGLEYLHSKQIVHRDIKPSNILISSEGVVKLADFGLSKVKTEGATSFSFTGHIGTEGWAAPELLQKNPEKFKLAVDIFSLGCVFCYVLTNGKHPFGSDRIERMANIAKGEMKNEVLNLIEDGELKRLTEEMISYRPEYRPSLEEIKVTFLKDLVEIKNDICLKIFRHVPDYAKSPDFMGKLCERGATLDVCDEYGKNLLHYACQYYEGDDFIEVICLLIEHGAKVDACDNFGWTPLHLACVFYKGNDLSQVIRLLIENGAKVDDCDKNGWTPLHYACKNYNGNDLSQVIRLLIENGAKVDACDNIGRTPLDFARMNKHADDVTIRLLTESDVRNYAAITWLGTD